MALHGLTLGQDLINRDELKGIANALKRARVSFEQGGEKLTSKSLIIDTELIRSKWVSLEGNYPDWEKLIPTEFNCWILCYLVDTYSQINALCTRLMSRMTLANSSIIKSTFSRGYYRCV